MVDRKTRGRGEDGRAGRLIGHPRRDQGERAIRLDDDQMIDSSEPASKHDRNQLAAARMKRIVNPCLERRTPGIVALPRAAWARAGSLAPSAKRHAATIVACSITVGPSSCEDLVLAHGDGRHPRLLKSLGRADLLILDDFGLEPLDARARHDLLEILEERYGRRPTIVTSQLPVTSWHEVIGDPTYADAILDRLIHNAHRIELTGESLRRARDKQAKSS